VKKFLIICLLLVHAAASSGTALSVHFCMGDYSGVGFAGDKQSKCSNCGMVDKKGCCHDETQLIKLDAPVAKSSLVEFGFSKLAPISTRVCLPIHFFSISNGMVDAVHHKPIDAGPPIHVMNCHFRI
jgi:hypothetical protein